jgi:hypothetical protein
MPTLLQSVSQTSVEHICNALPTGFVIAVFAWGILRGSKRQNAGTRFAVWFLALMAIASLPFISAFGQGGTRLLPSTMRPAIYIPENWALFIFMAWALGASIALLRVLSGLWHLRKLRGSCKAIHKNGLATGARQAIDSVEAVLGNAWLSDASLSKISASSKASLLAKVFGGKPITIAVSEEIRVPAAIGLWQRTIVLPAWALRELSAEDLKVILLHEFTHLRRCDDWTNLMQKIVRALFFFHPAVWWIDERLSIEREMACDDAVLAETGNPHGYATCLVSLLEKSMSRRGWAMAQAAVHRAREASLRLAQILDKNRPTATRMWTPAVSIVGIFSVLCFVGSAHSPRLIAFNNDSMTNSISERPHQPVAQAAPRYSVQPSAASEMATVIPASIHSTDNVALKSAMLSLPRNTSEILRRSQQKKSVQNSRRVDSRFASYEKLNRQTWRVTRASLESNDSINHAVPIFARQFRTMVFVQYINRDDAAPVLIQIWQVTFTNLNAAPTAELSAANSI